MSDRVARRRAQTRERIFTEAMRLFAEHGFDAVTVADITEAADIGKGTFFTHFPSKRDVFGYLGEQVSQVMVEAAAQPGPAPARLSGVMQAAAAWLEAHPEPAQQMVRARAVTAAGADSPNRLRARRALAELVSQGISRGELRPVPVEDATAALLAAYLACVTMWAEDPSRPLSARLETALDIVLGGLLPPGSPVGPPAGSPTEPPAGSQR